MHVICLSLSLLHSTSLSPVSGQYVFALSSDDNSELWLSTDDSPLNVQLLARVGPVCISFNLLNLRCHISNHT